MDRMRINGCDLAYELLGEGARRRWSSSMA